MFDFSRISEAVGGMLGQASGLPDTSLEGVKSTIAEAGLDVSLLQGLAPDQILELLGQHGIDISAFAPEQISSLVNSLDLGTLTEGPVGELLGMLKNR